MAYFGEVGIEQKILCQRIFYFIKNIQVRLHNGILCSRKKEGTPTLMTAWMELESIMLSEISQVVKDKYHMISPISGN